MTLEDVAAAAGVSKATASLVLNDRPGIATETRERVIAVVERLGYRVNRAAREVARGVSTTIGAVLTPTLPLPEVPNYYVAELLAGAEAEASASGYHLQVTASGADADGDRRFAGLAAVLYLGGSFRPEVLLQTVLPSVLVGTHFPQWPYDAVLADNSRGAYLAVKHLLDRGCRCIAFINGPSTTRTSELKLLGYREALAEAAMAPDSSLVRVGDFSVESGYVAAQQLFLHAGGGQRPDGVFVADDPMAIGALNALRDIGIRVPSEVKIVGYGDSPMGVLTMPTLSTVRVFQRRMGMFGARMLVERLTRHVEGYSRVLVGPELVVRGSSKAELHPHR